MNTRAIVHLFVGEDDLPLQKAARELINATVPEADQAFGLETVQGTADTADGAALALRSCADALRTPGLLAASGKVVWLRDAKFLGNAVVMRAEAVRERSRELVEVLGAQGGTGSVWVVTCPDMDRRSALFRFVEERGKVWEFGIPDKAYLLEKHAAERVDAEFKARGLRAGEEVLKEFAAIVGFDSRDIAAEAEKLSLFLGERRDVAHADVQAIVSRTSVAAVWDLSDAIGGKRFPAALSILRDLLAKGESPVGITVVLASRLRELILYREALDRGWAVAASGYAGRHSSVWKTVPAEVGEVLGTCLKRDPRKAHPFAASKLAGQARNYTMSQLMRNQRWVVEAHESLVSSGVSPQAVLESLLVRITR